MFPPHPNREIQRVWPKICHLLRNGVVPSDDESCGSFTLFAFKSTEYKLEYTQRMVRSKCLFCPCVSNACVPLCWQCTLEFMWLAVAPSKFGFGLYAHRPEETSTPRPVFPKGWFVCMYVGESLSSAEIARRYGCVEDAPYLVANVDCALARCPAAYANDYRGISARPNAKFVQSNTNEEMPFVFLQATVDIYQDEEILVDYGEAFWNHHATSSATNVPEYKTIKVINTSVV